MTVCGIALLLAVAAIALVDEGEVVTLVTFDAQGRPFETDLWVVDLDGSAYVRAAHPDEGWLERVRERPEVHLLRGGGLVTVRGVPLEADAVRQSVEAAMRAKYGWVERALLLLRDHSRAVSVRLEPLAAETR
jgi:hypothetical protein